MVSLIVSPTLTVDVYLRGAFDSFGSVVIYRERTDETVAVAATELDHLIAALIEARALLQENSTHPATGESPP